ncbi:MAG: SDR family oxidoreductase, partial [Alphaproteobacteria bacterium]|nr:SDR family oxidoreductase [Alphaproteobacteria bacterium]
LFIEHDVSNKAAWDNVISRATEVFGRIDVLVNNAGIYRPEPLQQTEEALLDLHYRVNVKGTFLGMASVREAMTAVGGVSMIAANGDETNKAMAAMIPLGRIGTPADIAIDGGVTI